MFLSSFKKQTEINWSWMVWMFIGKNLNGVNDSLLDAKAQTDIVTNKFFVPFIRRTKSIQLLEEIFSGYEELDTAPNQNLTWTSEFIPFKCERNLLLKGAHYLYCIQEAQDSNYNFQTTWQYLHSDKGLHWS